MSVSQTPPKPRMQQTPRIALVAGEVSGDWLGAGLIQALRRHYPDAHFEGVTGPQMRAAGCETLADIEALSLFGVSEVVREIPRVLGLRRQLQAHWLARRPDVFVGIDAPAFNTGLERRLRVRGIPTAHYVCPTAWAWRSGRVRSIRAAVDLLLSIFPFEPEFFERHRVPVRYVGHRLADELPLHPDPGAARRALGLDEDGLLLGLLPGSRKSEVRYLGPAFIATARWLRARLPGLRLVAPMATPGVATQFRSLLAQQAPELCPDNGPHQGITLFDGRSREVMLASDALLVASGTATLEAMLQKTPMVVAYALSPFNRGIAQMLGVHRIPYFSMPNLIAGRGVVPELRQTQVRPEILGPWLYRLLTSPAARAAQIDAFAAQHARLRCDADAAAAQAVAELMSRGQDARR